MIFTCDDCGRDIRKCACLLAEAIARLNRLSHNELRFGDLVALKCGRDNFSSFKLPKLREMVSAPALSAVEELSDTDMAPCLRWHLRGLDIDKAIRKVKTDREVSANAVAARAT